MMQILSPKVCPKCQKLKEPKEFHKDPRNKTGLTSWCNVCRRAANKKWRENNPDRVRDSARRTNLKRIYGITLEEFNSLLKEQNNQCCICKTKNPKGKGDRFHVDHCHTTGKVRGLLCGKCNCAIGLLNEDINLFLSAKEYLEKHNRSHCQVVEEDLV